MVFHSPAGETPLEDTNSSRKEPGLGCGMGAQATEEGGLDGARGPGFKPWLHPTSCATLGQLPWPSGLRFPIDWIGMAVMPTAQGWCENCRS